MRSRISASRVLVVSTVLAALVLAVCCAAALAAGFGSGDVVEVPVPGEVHPEFGPAGVSDLAVAPDGDLLAAVSSTENFGAFGVARLHQGGSVDRSFGTDGFTEPLKVPNTGRSEAQAEGIAATGSGGAVVAGYLRRSGGGTAPLLARYRPDGSLEPGFGNDGVLASTPPVAGGGTALHDVTIRSDGDIVAVGAVNERRVGRPAGVVTAYSSKGSVDRGFGKGGMVRLAAAHGGESYTGLLAAQALPHGKVLVAGYRGADLVLARLNKDGSFDRGFGDGDGIASVDVDATACCTEAASIALQRDGRIVVGGNGGVLEDYHEVLARFRPNGTLDPSFGRRGVVDIGHQRLRTLRAVAIQRSGRIVIVGEGISPGRSAFPFFTVLGFRPDGRVDSGFGHGGVVQFTGGQVSGARAAVTSGGRVVAGGGVRREAEGEYRYSLLLRRFG